MEGVGQEEETDFRIRGKSTMPGIDRIRGKWRADSCLVIWGLRGQGKELAHYPECSRRPFNQGCNFL